MCDFKLCMFFIHTLDVDNCVIYNSNKWTYSLKQSNPKGVNNNEKTRYISHYRFNDGNGYRTRIVCGNG